MHIKNVQIKWTINRFITIDGDNIVEENFDIELTSADGTDLANSVISWSAKYD